MHVSNSEVDIVVQVWSIQLRLCIILVPKFCSDLLAMGYTWTILHYISIIYGIEIQLFTRL